MKDYGDLFIWLGAMFVIACGLGIFFGLPIAIIAWLLKVALA